jgi:hypothetical protein
MKRAGATCEAGFTPRTTRSKPLRKHNSAAWVGLVTVLAACSEPQALTRLHVTIDADLHVREASVEVSARVEKRDSAGSGWILVAERRFTPGDVADWPLTIQAPVNGAVGGTYQLTATARDEREAVIAQARAIRTFTKSSSSGTLRVHFEDECLMRTKLCGQGETCHAGSCVSATTADSEATAETTAGSQRASDSNATSAELPADDQPMRATPAPECVGKDADHAFCDGETMRVCTDPLAPRVRPCGEHERCVGTESSVHCDCSIGFIQGEGGCRPATHCGSDNGGCDALTRCEVVASAIACSACPAGYGGDGNRGCVPLLAALDVQPATLEPAFSPEVTSYRVQAGLLGLRLPIRASAPDGTIVAIDGVPVEAQSPWTTRMLPLGETTVKLELTSSSGVHNTYNLVVQRSGAQDAFIKASNPGDNDLFGLGVALDGDTLVAGAPNEDGGAGGVNPGSTSGASTDSGAAYVFVREGEKWAQQAHLKAENPVANERFGASVAISGDVIAVGASGNDPIDRPTNATTSGAVYVFARSAGKWSQVARVAGDANASDLFGFQVRLTADRLYVGAPYESSGATRSGAVYVFDALDGMWTRRAKLKAARPIAESAFGIGFGFDANTLVVGAFTDSSASENAGSAYVFELHDGEWSERQRLEAVMPVRGANFGWSAAVLGDTLVVGAPRWGHYLATPSGEVYVFRRSADGWRQTAVLEAPVPRSSDYYGVGLELRPSMLMVAASGDWGGGGGLSSDFRDGSQESSGAIFLYSIEGDKFVRGGYIKADMPAWGDSFGVSFATSGNTLAIGSAFDNRGTSGVNPTSTAAARTDSGAAFVFH